MFNNAFVLDKLDKSREQLGDTPHSGPAPRKRVRSSPCLPQRLPSTGMQVAYFWLTGSHLHSGHVGVLEREAEEEMHKLVIRQLRHSPSPPPESPASEETPSESATPTTPTTPRSPIFGKGLFSRISGGSKPTSVGAKLWQDSEPQVCIPNLQSDLSRLTLVVMGGIQSDRKEGYHVPHGSP